MLSMFTALIDSEEGVIRFEKIYYAYRKQMFYVAREVLNNDELAEDAVQEALISIAKRIDHLLSDDRMIRAYVLTVARNTAFHLKKKEAENQHDEINYDTLDAEPNSSLEQQYIFSETVEELKMAISRLPDLYQDALLMRFVYDMDYNDIAKALKRSPVAVRQQVSRGKKMLIQMLDKEGML